MHSQAGYQKIFAILAIGVITALVWSLSLSASPSSSQPTRFEYKVISRRILTQDGLNQAERRYPEAHAEMLETTLNRLGKDGWEFVEISESFIVLRRSLP